MNLKVLSLNMYEGILLNEAVSFIKSQDPDIIMLQEVYGQNSESSVEQFRTLEVLKEQLNLGYNFFTPGLRHHREEGLFLIGNAIFSKHKITKTEAIFFNEPFSEDFVVHPDNNHLYPHSLQYTLVETPAGEVSALNIHGAWDLDGDNYSLQRKEMAHAILNMTENKPRVILAGDTNAKPTNMAIGDIQTRLVSVFGNDLRSTFNMSRKDNPGYATAAVDMMFTSHDVRVVEKQCLDVDVSDHLPLIVTVNI